MNRRKVLFKLSLTEFIYNGCFAAANFLSVFLESIGFSAGQIGLTMSLISGVGIASQPAWGVVSDRIRSVRRCFRLCMTGTALFALAVPFFSGNGNVRPEWLIAALALMYFFFHPSNMMMELWLVRLSAHPTLRISYGSVRSWASIGYAVLNLAFVPILRFVPVSGVYFFMAAFAAAAALLSLRVPAETENAAAEAPRQQRLRDMPFRSVLSYWVAAYILFEVLYQIPFNWRVTYTVYVLREFHVDNSLFGALMFTAGLCEVPVLLLTKKLSGRVGWAWPLILSTAILTLEYSLYAWGNSVYILFAAQLLRGFSYALFVAGRNQYIYRLAPRGMEGSTMALVNMVVSVTNLIAAAAGGFLVERLGTRSFFALLSALQLFSGVFFVMSHLAGSKWLKKTLPDAQCTLLR